MDYRKHRADESIEDYLETILFLHKKNGQVRSIDIATEMSFTKASVSVAMKNLRLNGYIIVDANGHITLSDTGREVAETIYERHTLLTSWLVSLGVDEKIAAEDACRMEHVISAPSFDAIRKHVQNHQKK